MNIDEGYTLVGQARPITVAATFQTHEGRFERTVKVVRPGELRKRVETVYRLMPDPPEGVEPAYAFGPPARSERGLAVGGDGVARVRVSGTVGGGLTEKREAISPLGLWRELDELADTFTLDEVARFGTHPTVAGAIRTAGLEILRAHVDGLRPLDRTKWLAHVAKAGTVRPWTPTLTAAGVDGFVDAVAQATDGLGAREVGRLVAALLGDGLETALERAIEHEAGSPAGPRTDRAA